MRLKKVLIILFIFLGLFITNSYATEFVEGVDNTVDIDITKIAENFNKSSYITKFANIGIKVYATQTNNSIILNYGNTNSLVYAYNPNTGVYTTYYPISSINEYLNAMLVDTIYTMQGNDEGVQLPYALDDTLSFAGIKDSGYEKSYTSDSTGKPQIKFQINPSVKLKLSDTSSPISDSIFMLNGTIYTKEDFIAKSGNLVFYKTFNENGLLELYIGQPNELNNLSYDSMLTALSIIFSNGSNLNQNAVSYIKQNYSDFSVGNSEFSGVSIDTSINSLPKQNADTIMVASNIKYAKFTIDVDTFNTEIDNVVIDEPNVGDSAKVSKNRVSAPLVISIVIIASVVIIMLVGILIRRNQKIV